MSKTIITISAVVLATAGSLFSQGLQNGDFRYPSDNPEIPESWTTFGDCFFRETGWAPQPPSGAMMGYHHYRVSGNNNSGMHQDVSGVKAGQKVRFSVLMMVDKHNEDSQRPYCVELILEGAKDGQQQTVASKEVVLEEFPTDDEWHEVFVEGTLPVDNLRVIVSVTPSPSGPRQSAVKFSEANLAVLD
jgi:hypothetical protein